MHGTRQERSYLKNMKTSGQKKEFFILFIFQVLFQLITTAFVVNRYLKDEFLKDNKKLLFLHDFLKTKRLSKKFYETRESLGKSD